MAIKEFGTGPEGQQALLCTMQNASGMTVEVLNYGATIHSITVPDEEGEMDDVLLGAATLEGYISGAPSAAVIGRVANRIGGAAFTLDGIEYRLQANVNANMLNAASGNYGRRLFSVTEATDNQIRLVLNDDGTPGFPGSALVEVLYTLDDDGTLGAVYTLVPTEVTPVNLTNHAYFNLAGQASGSVDDQFVQIHSALYTPTDLEDIPTGEVWSVEGTPLDFRNGQRMDNAFKALAEWGDWHNGYDFNFIVAGRGYREAARAWHPASGRTLTVYTDLPALQLYTANALTGKDGEGKDGVI